MLGEPLVIIVDEVVADLMSSRPRMGRRSSLSGENQVRYNLIVVVV